MDCGAEARYGTYVSLGLLAVLTSKQQACGELTKLPGAVSSVERNQAQKEQVNYNFLHSR